MSSKILSKLFWWFAFLCFLIFVQTDDDSSVTQRIEISDSARANQPATTSSSTFNSAYDNVLLAVDDDSKLEAIDLALGIALQERVEEASILRDLNLMAANIHQSRWHFIYALDYFQAAQAHVYDRNIDSKMKELRVYLSKVDIERGLNDSYIATKNTGPAKTFRGKILVAYVFVDDGIKTRWSNKTKQRTQAVMTQVQHWQQNRASDYQVDDIEFINKSFIARRNPRLKQPKSVSFESSNQDIQQYVAYIAASLGEKSIGDFIEKQTIAAGAEQGVVFLHTNLNSRSFAHRCGYTHQQKIYRNGRYETKMISQCNDEYVMLMEQVQRNRWDKMHYAQAHEMMHVFGAADLYNIKGAKDYAVTDIMNFQSKSLTHSRVEPITAFAIGWQQIPPNAPFQILER